MVHIQMKVTQTWDGGSAEQKLQFDFPNGDLAEFLDYMHAYNRKTSGWLEVPE